MDIALLTAFLSPFLPHLLTLGGKTTAKVTETVAEKFGEAAWEKAQKIWSKFQPTLEANEDLSIASKQVAAKPDSKARQEVFQEELATVLTNNPDLAKAIAQIMEEDSSNGSGGTVITQTVTGDKNQTIGIVSGGTVVGNVEGNVTL